MFSGATGTSSSPGGAPRQDTPRQLSTSVPGFPKFTAPPTQQITRVYRSGFDSEQWSEASAGSLSGGLWV